MSPTPLDVENPIEVSLIRLMQGHNPSRPALTFPDVSHGYMPGRGLFFSVIVHELIVAAILLLSFTLSRTRLPDSRSFNDTIKLSDAKGVIYLPVLGGGSEGSGHAGARRGIPARNRRRRRRAAARDGVSRAATDSFRSAPNPPTSGRPSFSLPGKSRSRKSCRNSCLCPTW